MTIRTSAVPTARQIGCSSSLSLRLMSLRVEDKLPALLRCTTATPPSRWKFSRSLEHAGTYLKVRKSYIIVVMIAADLQLPISQKALARLLRRGGVTQAFVFGSYARGEQTPESDLDLFVRVKRGVSLFDVIGLQSELEKHAGVPIDLATKINPHFGEYIEPELVEIEL